MTRQEAIDQYFADENRLGTAFAYSRLTSEDWGRYLWRHIPEHMQSAVAQWILFGKIPGEFLQAVIRGDLFEAAARADEINQRALFDYCVFFHNGAPSSCKQGNALRTWKGLWPAEAKAE